MLHSRLIREAECADFLNHCRPLRGEIRLAPIEQWHDEGDSYWPTVCRLIGDAIDWVVDTYKLNCDLQFALSAPVSLNGKTRHTLPFATLSGDNKYYICLNHELIHYLNTICTIVSSNNKLLELLGFHHANWIGTPISNPELLDTSSMDPSKFETAVIDINAGIITTKEASLLALRLWRYAIEALVFHEMAHIKNGHLLLLKKKREGAIIHEDGLDPINNDIKRALEFDADAFMCNALLNRRSGHFKDDTLAGNYSKLEENIREYSISIFLLFKMLNDGRDSRDLSNCVHAPALLRSMACPLHVIPWSADTMRVPMDWLANIVVSSIVCAEAALPLNVARLPLHADLYSDFILYVRSVSGPWNSIRDLLDELKLGGKIAPKHDLC